MDTSVHVVLVEVDAVPLAVDLCFGIATHVSAHADVHPEFEREENTADGYLQYYMCSHNQLELYFRRFGPDAEILYPQALRDKIADYHRLSLQVYDASEDDAIRQSRPSKDNDSSSHSAASRETGLPTPV